MKENRSRVRVAHSFAYTLGADRISYTAWQQVRGVAEAGGEVLAFPGASCRPVPTNVRLHPTLSRGRFKLPYKLIGGSRALALHDHIVAKRVAKLGGQIDVVHTWPSAARRTIEIAKKLGIPTVLERCNAHTRYGFEVVKAECDRLGIKLPASNESAWNEQTLRIEEEEFRLADHLLCPSEFVVKTFLDKGFPAAKLLRHSYGFDGQEFYPYPEYTRNKGGIKMLFVGSCAVRKGVHFALQAWLKSSAKTHGTFTIAGEFLPDYAAKLEPMLKSPSVRVLGHRKDIPELMRNHDILVLPSLEEGFPLVCMEAFGSGCVPVVSEVCLGICEHRKNAMVHRIGDVEELTEHINTLDGDRELLQSLREAGLKERGKFTWDQAGQQLLDGYRQCIAKPQLRQPAH
jgi:glycosyltransferase involved in cell wall biosynthesis